MARLAKYVLLVFMMCDLSILQAVRASERPIASDLISQRVAIWVLRNVLANSENRMALRNFVGYTLKKEGYSSEEITGQLRAFDKIQITFLAGGKTGCKNALACLSFMSSSNGGQLVEVVSVTETELRARMNGKSIEFTKGQELRLRERARQFSGYHVSVLDLIMGLLIPKAEAVGDMAEAAALGFIGVIVLCLLGTLVNGVNAIVGKARLGGRFCCDVAKTAKSKLTEIKRNGARCLSDLSNIFSGSMPRTDALELETVRKAKSFWSTEDDKYLKAFKNAESIPSAIANETRRVLKSCESVDSTFDSDYWSSGLAADVKVNNDAVCIDEFRKSGPFLRDMDDFSTSYKECLELARDENLLRNPNNFDYYRQQNTDKFKVMKSRFDNASKPADPAVSGSKAAVN